MSLFSVLVPCLQEENFIAGCLESVQAFELPPGAELEILVLDGMSTDRTREIVAAIAQNDKRIRIIDNVKRRQASALNLGIAAARGEYILRLDAHSSYPADYLRLAFETALRTGADNTGGVFVTMRRNNRYQSAIVQAVTTHRFGVGNSGFRTDAPEGEADTVPYGFFRREIFSRVGLFDERLLRGQDYEMNRRIALSGGKIWMNPRIRVRYFQQPDMQSFIRKQLIYEAPYNAFLWYLAPYAFAPRHAITGVFALGVISGAVLSPISTAVRIVFGAVMALYILLALAASIQQAVRYREPRHLLTLPLAFFLYHFLHGFGILVGLARLATGTAPVQQTGEPWPGAGRFRAWQHEANTAP